MREVECRLFAVLLRAEPHYAPLLVEDPEVTRRVDALAAPVGPLHGLV
jgi:4-hydroxy-3-polyprenylbenzoate decarboxylase